MVAVFRRYLVEAIEEVGVMLDIPSQYMHYCLVLLCYCVRNRDHCCVLCDVARDLLLTWYIVHQPEVVSKSKQRGYVNSVSAE